MPCAQKADAVRVAVTDAGFAAVLLYVLCYTGMQANPGLAKVAFQRCMTQRTGQF